jgi:hypothetical protein
MGFADTLSPYRRARWVILIGVWCLLAACSKGNTSHTGPASATPSPSGAAEAVIAVERAVVFLRPERDALPLTYLYQRERVPVRGQTPDGVFLLVTVNDMDGWILSAQVDLTGDLSQIAVVTGTGTSVPTPAPFLTPAPPTPTLTMTPFPAATSEGQPTETPFPTRTPLPSLTPTLAGGALQTVPVVTTDDMTVGPDSIPTSPSIRVGSPPPLSITLPEGWQAVHLLLPFRTYDAIQDVPLSIYTGSLPGGVTGYIYLFWGFPTIANPTGENNLWASGLQLLRGTLVGESCNLGIKQEQQTFYVGGKEAIGTYYSAVSCVGENDTAGWFAALQVDNGNYAFFTAVEPLDALPAQAPNLQAILDSVQFLPPASG